MPHSLKSAPFPPPPPPLGVPATASASSPAVSVVRVLEDSPSSAYDVTIGHGILGDLPAELRRLAPKASVFVVVTDDVVWNLHWPTLCAIFKGADWAVREFPPPRASSASTASTTTTTASQQAAASITVSPTEHSTCPTSASSSASSTSSSSTSSSSSSSQWQQQQLSEGAKNGSPCVVALSIGRGGEENKTRAAKARIEDRMIEVGCHRDCVVIALGGGIVGDLAGFAAATFMRGVPFVQVPTTMLAIVDAAVGGKTAVNTPAGKNLIGAFHQPLAVWVDLELLGTLPTRHMVNGLAEVVKMAACLDCDFFEQLERSLQCGALRKLWMPEHACKMNDTLDDNDNSNTVTPKHRSNFATASRAVLLGKSPLLAHIVHRSVQLKARVVQQDEREHGLRAVLNWGHTLGHGIESLLEPHLLHGECVAIGCVLECKVSRILGHCDLRTEARVENLFRSLGLPTAMPTEEIVAKLEAGPSIADFDPAAHGGGQCDAIGSAGTLGLLPLHPARVLEQMAVDKKNTGGTIKCVLLSGIGSFLTSPVARRVKREHFEKVILKSSVS
eukprot:INCI7214.7.p1 GENE.INCI7214.7~~INCI7214.7.p1  ORF type:complete len:611 (-),score=120.51 INCI7214.7:54-1730(-)